MNQIYLTIELPKTYYKKLEEGCKSTAGSTLFKQEYETPGEVIRGIIQHHIAGLNSSIKVILTGEQEVEKEKPQVELPDNVKAVIESCK